MDSNETTAVVVNGPDLSELPEALRSELALPGGEAEQAPAKSEDKPAAVVVDIDAERDQRRPATAGPKIFDTVEDARARYIAATGGRAAAPVAEREEEVDYNSLPDLNAAAKTLEERFGRRLSTETARIQADALRRHVAVCERNFARTHADFYAVVQKSGVMDLIGTDGGTRAPRDAFLNAFIYSQDDPAEALYEYAQGKLAKTTTAEAETRGEARGRAETLETIERAASRPTGIAKLPSASGVGPKLSRELIAAQSDEWKRKFKKARPDLWDAIYLGRSRSA